MKIIFSRNALLILSISRKYYCAFLFLGFYITFQAQIYQSTSSILYISEGATVTEFNNNNDIDKNEIKRGKIFVSENTLIHTLDNTLSGQFVSLETIKKSSVPKEHVASYTKTKKVKTEKIPELNNKPDFKFVSGDSDYVLEVKSSNEHFSISNTNTHLKAIFNKNTIRNNCNVIVLKSINCYSLNKNNFNEFAVYFSIRPPPYS